MQYVTYGNTGLQVSRVGFGGMRLKDQKDEESCASLVKACYDAGINYFDTAPGYGESERLMGLAFAEMTKTRTEKPFYVSTKTFAYNVDTIRQEFETSLERLQVPYVDFYHLWCLTSLEDFHKRRASLKVFEQLKSEGLVKHIVASTHMVGGDVGKMLAEYPFDGVLIGYSAMNFAFRDQGLTDIAKAGKAVVIMNPLGGGLIPQHPEMFDFVKTRPDETVVEGALRFLFNDPRITVALVGMSEPEHLHQAVKAVDGFRPIPEAEVTRIREGLKGAFNAICTGCGYCAACPGELPIAKLMDSYNQLLLTGDKRSLISRLRYHWHILPDGNNIDHCIECGKCEGDCTQKLPIIERLGEIRAEIANWAAAVEAKKKNA